MKKYRVLAHSNTMNKVKDYQQRILSSETETGFYFYKGLKGKNIEKLTIEEFLEVLINTKKPQIFAESSVKGDGSDWNLDELSILGDVSIATPVEIFDNGAHTNPLVYDTPYQGELVFMAGALLRNDSMNTPVDWYETTVNNQLSFDGYYQLYERRLLPVFHYINSMAQDKKAVITIPGLGCGMFAGEFRGKVGEVLNQTLQKFITEYHIKFPNIRAVYYDPFRECSNERYEIGDISLLVRPLTQNNTGKSQLSKVDTLEDVQGEFVDTSLFSIVAWDHVSWPGNDFYVGSRATDDGVKAAATNSMFVMTGVKGMYDTAKNKYNPPAEYQNWKEVIFRNELQIDVVNNLEVL